MKTDNSSADESEYVEDSHSEKSSESQFQLNNNEKGGSNRDSQAGKKEKRHQHVNYPSSEYEFTEEERKVFNNKMRGIKPKSLAEKKNLENYNHKIVKRRNFRNGKQPPKKRKFDYPDHLKFTSEETRVYNKLNKNGAESLTPIEKRILQNHSNKKLSRKRWQDGKAPAQRREKVEYPIHMVFTQSERDAHNKFEKKQEPLSPAEMKAHSKYYRKKNQRLSFLKMLRQSKSTIGNNRTCTVATSQSARTAKKRQRRNETGLDYGRNLIVELQEDIIQLQERQKKGENLSNALERTRAILSFVENGRFVEGKALIEDIPAINLERWLSTYKSDGIGGIIQGAKGAIGRLKGVADLETSDSGLESNLNQDGWDTSIGPPNENNVTYADIIKALQNDIRGLRRRNRGSGELSEVVKKAEAILAYYKGGFDLEKTAKKHHINAEDLQDLVAIYEENGITGIEKTEGKDMGKSKNADVDDDRSLASENIHHTVSDVDETQLGDAVVLQNDCTEKGKNLFVGDGREGKLIEELGIQRKQSPPESGEIPSPDEGSIHQGWVRPSFKGSTTEEALPFETSERLGKSVANTETVVAFTLEEHRAFGNTRIGRSSRDTADYTNNLASMIVPIVPGESGTNIKTILRAKLDRHGKSEVATRRSGRRL